MSVAWVSEHWTLYACIEFVILQNESYNFITFDNLDEKIQEAIQNEVNYNFALTHSGKKIT